MQWVLVVCAALLMLAQPVVAQDETAGVSTVGVVFFGPGGVSDGTATIHLGGGGEFIWPNGLGVAMDAGYISSATEFTQGVGLLAAGPIYQFGSSHRYRPYVRGGVTLALDPGFQGAQPLMHFGGGLNQWFSERWGLKYEVRDHFDPRYPGFQVVEFNIGLLFRPR